MNSRKYLLPTAALGCSAVVLVVLQYPAPPKLATKPASNNQQPTDKTPSIADIQARALATADKLSKTEAESSHPQGKTKMLTSSIAASGGIVEKQPYEPLLTVFRQVRQQWEQSQYSMAGDGNWLKLILRTDYMFSTDIVIRESYRNMLATLPSLLAAADCGRCMLAIEAHTDNRQESSTSLQRSQAMAEATAKLLADNGWHKQQLRWQGLGATQPVSPNNHPLIRAANRRITLKITVP